MCFLTYSESAIKVHFYSNNISTENNYMYVYSHTNSLAHFS